MSLEPSGPRLPDHGVIELASRSCSQRGDVRKSLHKYYVPELQYLCSESALLNNLPKTSPISEQCAKIIECLGLYSTPSVKIGKALLYRGLRFPHDAHRPGFAFG